MKRLHMALGNSGQDRDSRAQSIAVLLLLLAVIAGLVIAVLVGHSIALIRG